MFNWIIRYLVYIVKHILDISLVVFSSKTPTASCLPGFAERRGRVPGAGGKKLPIYSCRPGPFSAPGAAGASSGPRYSPARQKPARHTRPPRNSTP